MSSFELPAYGWSPRADQLPEWKALTSPELRKAEIVAHRRYGKDELCLHATCIQAMRRVGSYWYCLPEYEQARKNIWDMVNWRTGRKRIDDAFPPEIVAHKDNESMILTLESTSTIQLIGSDRADSLVGGGQVGIVLSEAAVAMPKAKELFMPIIKESKGWLIEISTPRGKNHFYRSFLGAKEDMLAGKKGVFASFRSAEETSVFTPEELKEELTEYIRINGENRGRAVYEQEYLCNFESAVNGAVWGAELNELAMEGRVRPCTHDRRFPVMTSWDLGVGDATAILFWQEVNGEYRLIDAHEESGLGLDTYVGILKNKHQEKGYNYSKHYAPHDINVREWGSGAVSRIAQAQRLGLTFEYTKNIPVKTQLGVASQLIRQMVVNADCPEALHALEMFKAYRYPVNKATGTIIPTPVHDHASHSSSALCTYAYHVAKGLGLKAYKDAELHSAENEFDDKFAKRKRLIYGADPNRPSRGAF
jgi:phage terminase large subunit